MAEQASWFAGAASYLQHPLVFLGLALIPAVMMLAWLVKLGGQRRRLIALGACTSVMAGIGLTYVNLGTPDLVGEEPPPPAPSPQPEPPAASAPPDLSVPSTPAQDPGTIGSGSVVHPPPLSAQLADATVAFNRPDRLHYLEVTTIELVLAPITLDQTSIELLSLGLEGTSQTAPAKYALHMQALLDGADFEVAPKGPQDRTALSTQETRWSWTIRPTAFGPKKTLRLELLALVRLDRELLPPVPIRTFYATFAVDVTLWQWLIAKADELSTVHVLATGIGGTSFVVLAWFWRKPRRRAANIFGRRSIDLGSNSQPHERDRLR